MIITRKIQLIPIGDNAEEKNATWAAVRKLSLDVFKAANLIVNHQFFNELLLERLSKTDPELAQRSKKLQTDIEKLTIEMGSEKDATAKEKIAAQRKKLFADQNMLNKEARNKMIQLLATSQQNSTYQEIGKHFADMPSQIKSALNMEVVHGFNNSIFDVKHGNKSLQTFRNGMPIPFDKVAMRFMVSDKNEVVMNWLNGISFMLNFGRDKSNNRAIIDRAMSGEYKYSNSKIQIKARKIYLLFCVDIPVTKTELDPNVIVGVNLGISVPAYCSVNNSKDRLAIGNIEEFFRVRVQMQARRRRLQAQLKLTTGGGRGRKDKLKALDQLKEKETNFAKTYNHNISKAIIAFAQRNNAGVIIMELLEGYGENVPDSIVLRNWGYFQLHTMTEYKAKQAGIEIRYSDPHLISQTCCVCGKYHENNLDLQKRELKCQNQDCKSYNVPVFLDYNASQNNCLSPRYVESKKDCIVYKRLYEVV